jgi:hypothetical protein
VPAVVGGPRPRSAPPPIDLPSSPQVGAPVATPSGSQSGPQSGPDDDAPVPPIASGPGPTAPPGPGVDRGGRPRATAGEGTLSLGAKPPCEIFIDGKSTGLRTPQREIILSSGKHKVTLLNNEFGIKESFTVDIRADETVKMVKDFSDRLPASP